MNFREIITCEILCDYLTAEYGHDLAIWADGSTEIIESSLCWRHDDTAPICRVKCPGIGNLDSTVFSEGYANRDESGVYYDYDGLRIGTLVDLIIDCCEHGDVSSFIEDLVEKCIE